MFKDTLCFSAGLEVTETLLFQNREEVRGVEHVRSPGRGAETRKPQFESADNTLSRVGVVLGDVRFCA